MTAKEILQEEVEIYRRMSPQQRLQVGFDLSELSRIVVRLSVRFSYPEWDEDQVQEETSRRLLLAAGLPEDHPYWRWRASQRKTE